MTPSAKSKSSLKTTPKIRVRLQKVIAQAGIASRRSAEELIQTGRVTLNGETVLVLGTQMVPEVDVLEVDGERVSDSISIHDGAVVKVGKRRFVRLVENKG